MSSHFPAMKSRADILAAQGITLSSSPLTLTSCFKRAINAAEHGFRAAEHYLAPPDPLTTVEGLTARNSLHVGDPVCTCADLDDATRQSHLSGGAGAGTCPDVASSRAVQMFLDTAKDGWTRVTAHQASTADTEAVDKRVLPGKGWYGPFRVLSMHRNPYLHLSLNERSGATDPASEPLRELGLYWKSPHFPYTHCTCSPELLARGSHSAYSAHDAPRLADESRSPACTLTFGRYDTSRVADYDAELVNDGHLHMTRKKPKSMSTSKWGGGARAETRTAEESDAAFAAFLGAGAGPREMLLSGAETVKGVPQAMMWIRP